jgi:hypothetical protein
MNTCGAFDIAGKLFLVTPTYELIVGNVKNP